MKANQDYQDSVNEIHVSLMQKEVIENFNRVTLEPFTDPIHLHEVTKEYRTKMTDWMVEVCTSFKCSKRTYFLSTQVFDHVLMLLGNKGKQLVNKDVHSIGVTSMYVASKYEDIYPLHSKIVSEKIAHKAITAKDVLKKEQQFL
jgi:cyclin B